MKFRIFILSLILSCFGMFAADVSAQDSIGSTDRQTAILMEVRGPIGPAVTDYIRNTLTMAEKQNADLAIIEMHTPGGLVIAMQDIIQDILKSPIPVVTYVSPSGSHAASAGTYILYASHIAAMSPATNLGAATPVQMGGSDNDKSAPEKTGTGENTPKDASAMELKSVNDAVAYIRGLAELRGRNADWAEKAVRDAVSLNATEAKRQNVIDIVANDLDDLMAQIDRKTVQINSTDHVIETSNIDIIEAKPNWRTKILMIITDPNIAFFLMTIGFYGLIYEFANPGAMIPGIVGVICLSIGLFALNILPVNYAGLLLLLLGIGLMSAESFVPSFGILGIGGAIAFALGGTMLIETDIFGFGVSWELIATMTALSVLIMVVVLGLVIKSHKRKVTTGIDALIGAKGKIKEWSGTKGVLHVWSEDWTAFSATKMTFKKGDPAYVVRKDGLRLEISNKPPLTEEKDI